ncbi:EAL domain-containing protein [Duganella sp. BJB488]|uniref:EAL domain-containing protein n=1 Tax=unclassified Duganella TaxID=2636909 RepID=UPI000E3546A1|nr:MULTISPECIES: EAL domain-containing protein [unclassified Duganella]RFP10949.1 EAL domain-containing protein [Duganella sp. BJB489]RFP14502.1 EAL domain-containing protein [Duganella sp. BJB488]RFP30438.1 EAL domain-containing protein [Duganella sp. BJB480]
MNRASNRRILLIDDLPSIHVDFRKILTPPGNAGALDAMEAGLFGMEAMTPAPDFELDSAYQGDEAVAMVEQALRCGRPYALAFVDMRMPPGPDGLETIELLWQRDTALQIVICSAYTDYSWRNVLTRLNCGDRLLILKKPFDNIEVYQLASTLSAKWEATRRLLLHLEQMEATVQERTSDLRNEVQVRLRAETALRLRNRAMESTVNAIVITSFSQREATIEYVNPAFERITGYAVGEVIGRDMRFLQGDDRDQDGLQELREAMQSQREGHAVLRNYRKDGSLFWNELYIAPVCNEEGKVDHYVGVMNDITAARDYQRQLEHQANYDILTDLPNRALLQDRMAQAIAHAQRAHERLAVLWIDLDRFKYVNDTFGHAVGDALLKDVSARLKMALRGSDTVARVGGDEFVAMVLQLDKPLEAGIIGRQLLATISLPFHFGGLELQVGASIGVSIYPEDGITAEILLKHADAAMYNVKERGRNDVEFHTLAMSVHVQQRATLENALRLALGRGELRLDYQPKIHVKTGQMRGVEALLRWHHPEHGILSPASFVPLAEDTGLIVVIGEWVLRTACVQVRAWHAAGHLDLSVSVNVSARQFRQPNLANTIAGILAETGLEARYLELELTESVIMQDSDGVIETLRALKTIGVTLSLDDFGTGYSSLSYLKRFPIDIVKIDQSFIRDVTSDPGDASLTKAIITMAHSLGLKAIAEGVETEGQLGFLASQQCDEVQGYLFSHPVAAATIDAILCGALVLPELVMPGHRDERTVLLVDDQPHVIAALQRVLRRSGYRILTAAGGAEGLELLARSRVDIIVSDQSMPGMSGVEFLRRAKEIYPESVRMILSGDVDIDVVIDAVNEGAIARIFLKPWDEQHLRDHIELAFHNKETGTKTGCASLGVSQRK